MCVTRILYSYLNINSTLKNMLAWGRDNEIVIVIKSGEIY